MSSQEWVSCPEQGKVLVLSHVWSGAQPATHLWSPRPRGAAHLAQPPSGTALFQDGGSQGSLGGQRVVSLGPGW